jgi:hypothetical protein
MTRNVMMSPMADIPLLDVADPAIRNITSPAELSYWLGAPLLRERVFAVDVSSKPDGLAILQGRATSETGTRRGGST